jgi:hypothetical protein
MTVKIRRVLKNTTFVADTASFLKKQGFFFSHIYIADTVLILWLVLYVVALPISDGLHPPDHGLYEVHQLLPPLKSCLKSNFIYKFADS